MKTGGHERAARRGPKRGPKRTTHAPRQETASGFVGREKERGRLVEALHQALRGPGRLHLVVGEPGIGKTRLLEELAEHARAESVRVL
jgi:ATP-dependent Clp protease ATP-binding subunit ClpA